MSDPVANVQLVWDLYSAFGKRDIPAILERLSPDVEWPEPSNPFNPAGGMHHGHKGFLEWADVGRRSEDIQNLEINKILADENSAAVICFMRCRAIPTDKVYESDFVHYLEFENGKVKKFQEFFDTYIAGEAFH
jgi:ketosteroid isomerase-like protein